MERGVCGFYGLLYVQIKKKACDGEWISLRLFLVLYMVNVHTIVDIFVPNQIQLHEWFR